MLRFDPQQRFYHLVRRFGLTLFFVILKKRQAIQDHTQHGAGGSSWDICKTFHRGSDDAELELLKKPDEIPYNIISF